MHVSLRFLSILKEPSGLDRFPLLSIAGHRLESLCLTLITTLCSIRFGKVWINKSAQCVTSGLPTLALAESTSFHLHDRHMSDWLAVILLGVIEGVTEFLPVSSTGHLLLTEHLIRRQFSEVFNVVIQCGAVLAVLLVFAKRSQQLVTQWREPDTRDYLLKLIAAFVLTAVGGLVMKKMGLKLEKTTAPIAWATLIGGVLFLVLERWLRGRTGTDKVSWTVALAIGAAQLVAIAFPGSSRSGTTILLALVLGLARPAAIEFSFLLGIPTLLAAGAKQLLDAVKEQTPHEPWSQVLVGTVVSAVTAFAVVRWLLRYVQNHTFESFGWYRVALGIAILVLMRD